MGTSLVDLDVFDNPCKVRNLIYIGYKDWMCNLYKLNFILCKDCQKHQGPQDWLKANFRPNLGRTNLINAWKEFNSNNALINSIQVQPEHQPAGIADIEDIMDEGDTVYVRAVLVNQLRIGRACTPFEVIRVRTNSGYYPIVLMLTQELR